MESVMKNNYCAFTVYLDGSDEEGESKKDSESMQAAFEKFRRQRQKEFQRIAGRKVSVLGKLLQPDGQWELRMKFLEQAKSYIGVPYAKKYHEPGSPEHESPLFLDCCGLIRRVIQDLTEDFGFYIGPGNQAYQYDTLPITLSSEEHLKPGDLVFISGTYFDTQRKRQPHDIVHVEIWLGDGERSLGARWKRGCVQIFDSYKFVSSSYGGVGYHFKSIETWLQGVCTSYCWGWRHYKKDIQDPKSIVSRRDEYMRMFESRTLNDLQAQALSSLSNLADGEPTNEPKSKGHKATTKATPRMSHPEEKKPEDAPRLGPFFYIGGANGVEMLNLYCRNKGWQRIHDNRREDYILKWCETKFRDTYYNFREGEQLLYQIPNNKILTTKIGLLMNLREYERVMRKISKNCRFLKMEEFFPETFRLDTKDEREIFFEIYREPHIWICKPTGSNQGRGIFLLKNQSEVKELQAKLQNMEDDPVYKKLPYKIPQARIVQRYIDRPLLLEGKKFDVRSYLLIACTVPYMLFFGHGYARLTCLNYNPKSEDLTAHLTNQYVQKKSPMYSAVKEETVWRMDRFNNYVNERFRHAKGLPKDWVFNGFTKRMKEIMLQCFLAVKSKLDCKLGYFDLIGCDFLIDEDFKVWLLEMNANPALHTNCSALKSIIPTVVNETLDLAIEIFTKCQKGQPLLPLDSLCHFVLLYNGSASDLPPPRLTKSRTSIRSLRSYRPHLESGSFCNSSGSTSNTRLADKHPAKPSEKGPKAEPKAEPKTEPSGLPEGLSLPPSKGCPRNALLMPQIQISIVPSLMGCSPVKAILRSHQVCASGNQYIIKQVPATEKQQPGPTASKADSGDDKVKTNAGNAAGAISKDRSYAAWFQQTFGTKFPSAVGNGTGLPLTSSQMVSFHLQSNIPPSLPGFQELSKPFRQLMTLAKPLTEDGKTTASDVTRSCGESPPEDKKVSHRGS